MKVKKMVLIGLLIFISSCQSQIKEDESIQSLAEQSDLQKTIVLHELNGEQKFILVDDLVEKLNGDYKYDQIHRTLELQINEDNFYLVDGVPVLEKNGEYIASDEIHLKITNEKLFLPTQFVEVGIGATTTIVDDLLHFQWYGQTQQVFNEEVNAIQLEDLNVEQLIDHLSFLEKPIKGAEVSKIPGHLPGAPRPYRNGYHEGIDWYDYASGGGISTDTPVYAMGEGVVVRADHNFVEYHSAEEREKDLSYAAEIGETPEYIFDKLRGRQVWVQYEGGVMNRFAHLHDIPADIQVGTKVNGATIIGYVGNSGTSDSVDQNYEAGLHLHQDLFIYGELFWTYLDEGEVIEVLEQIW
ncbi:M23 family metallopeptidase [Halalkalibacter krulwichiae]|uniref:Peptidase family M23 n=1 Tax=Halalkalibacter krulwichiae TaxID=199441 RepID=A0A1X9MCK2_9BACI|nr:peptidoglycan DD-metalloendopeptidase family protein [Halalkalibacter krulwichiae]ARK31165.1 Peptidase family M23 [Halalkalibacter krulwichiae]